MSQGARADGNGSTPETEADSQAARDTDQTRLEADQTRVDADQTLSDADQTGSETDQHDAEVDQASSKSDQSLADSDQEASDRDQKAADDDLAGGHPGVDRLREYQATKSERKISTVERTATAVHRTQTAVQRLDAAERREEASRLRDLVAEARDRAAEERDRQAALTEPTGPAAEARARAAADRARAALDRERAAAERKQAAIDRQMVRAALEEANLDELTGTFRRGQGALVLQGELERARRSGGQLVLAFVDVDGLKEVNDRDGHAAGDALLIDVVETIRSQLRSYDPIVRFGGDEFVCVIGALDLDGVRRRFEGIDRELARKREGASISVGLAELRSGDTLDDLTSRGDAALYAVKRHRRAQESATA
jgi:diguanylate cyclase (GGDEF)-like protein